MKQSTLSVTPAGRIAARWFLFLSFFHLLPAPWYMVVVAGLAPAAFLFAAGLAGLFNTDSSSLTMAVMLLAPALLSGLVFALLAYLLAAGIGRFKQPVIRTLSLLSILAVCGAAALNPIYVSGGHGGGDAFSVRDFIDIPGQFRVPAAVSISYFIGLALLLGLLLVYQHAPQAFPTLLQDEKHHKRLVRGSLLAGIVVFVVLFCWVHRMLFFVRPLATMGFASAQYRLAMALKAQVGSEFRSDVTYRQWLERAAAQGHPASAMALSHLPLSADDRLHWLTVAAEGGLAEAQFRLYRLLAGASPAASRTQTALHWLRAAAESGWADARYELGRLLSRGDETLEIEKNPTAARDWWEKAADRGHGGAMKELAWRYEIGADRFPRDPERSVALLKQLAQGYQEGRYGLPQNSQLAASHLQRADRIHALDQRIKAGDPIALATLGRQLLQVSDAAGETKAEGLSLLEQAAAGDDAEIKYELGAIYMFGNHGVGKDFDKGRRWWDQAAAKNHVRTMEYLAPAFQNGRFGYPVDLLKSKELTAKLVEAYRDGGYGVDPDDDKARYWARELKYFERLFDLAGGTYLPLADLRRQANASNPAAQYQLGRQMLVSGAPAERKEGLRWIERAAANGLAEAQYRLVTYYENQLHIMQQDPKRGVALLEAAARQNHLPAMGTLALAHHKGRYGLEKDYRQARDWYAKLLQVYASGQYDGEIDDRFIDFQKRQLGYATRALEVQEEKTRRFQQASPLERRVIEITENYRKQYEQAVNALDRRDGSVGGAKALRAEMQRLRQTYIDLREQEIEKLNSGVGQWVVGSR